MKTMLKKFAASEWANSALDWTVLMTGVVLFTVALVATAHDSLAGKAGPTRVAEAETSGF